jgi:hypothetical protein
MLGIGLQTTGVLLVLRALTAERPRELPIAVALICFGVAFSLKQLFVAAPIMSALLLIGAVARGRLGFAALVRAFMLAAAIPTCAYGIEEWGTAGQMSRAVVTAAVNVGRVHPAGWSFAVSMFGALTWKCAGLYALWGAAGVAVLANHPGRGRRAVAGAGTAIVAMIVTLEVFQTYYAHMAISIGIVIGVLLLVVLVLPGSGFHERRWLFGSPVDRALWLYLIGELAIVAVLSGQSTGAWYNYALQAVVFAAVLTARALSRAFAVASRSRQLVPAALAAMSVPLFAFTDANEVVAERHFERESVTRLLAQIGRKPTEIFFVDRPGDNRLHGRLDLVYDPWLYPVFETIGLAEPRSVWLASALSTGPVRVVVASKTTDKIDGIPRNLFELGFRPKYRLGPLLGWER